MNFLPLVEKMYIFNMFFNIVYYIKPNFTAVVLLINCTKQINCFEDLLNSKYLKQAREQYILMFANQTPT